MVTKEKARVCVDLSVFIYSHFFIQKKIGNEITPESLTRSIESQVGKIVAKLQKKFHIIETILCLDSYPFRHEIYDGYKGNRSEILPFSKDDLIPYITYDYLKFERMEADDILWLYSEKYDNTILVTEDLDQLQSVRGTTKLYKYKSDTIVDKVNHTYEAFKKMLLGCTGDFIPSACNISENKLDKFHQDMSSDDGTGVIKATEFMDMLDMCGYDVDRDIANINKELAVFKLDTYEKYFSNFKEIFKKI